MEKQRLLYIDQLRGLVMLMVVLQHLVHRTTPPSEINNIMSIVGNFRMPLFFFVSGYIINKVTKIDNGVGVIKFYKKKAINLLIPTITWSLIVDHLFFSNELQLPTWNDIINCFTEENHLWFLTTLFYMMIIVGLYRFAVIKNKKILSLFVLMLSFGIFTILYINFGILKKCISNSPYFFGGLLISTYPLLEKLIRNNYIYAISILIFCCISRHWIMENMSLSNIIIHIISALTGIIVIYNLVNRVHWNNYIDRLIRLVGINTLSIYVAHWYFMDTVSLSSNWLFALIQLIICSIIIALVCIGIDKLLSNLKIFRLLFYGKLN